MKVYLPKFQVNSDNGWNADKQIVPIPLYFPEQMTIGMPLFNSTDIGICSEGFPYKKTPFPFTLKRFLYKTS